MKLGKKKEKETNVNSNDDFLAQEAKEDQRNAAEYTLDIPDDEIWTYQIEGLQAPRVGKSYKNDRAKKIIVVVVLLVAISASIFLSVWAVHSDTYNYKQLSDGTYELVRFSNPGDITDVTIDYVVDNDTGKKDYSKPVTVIDEYAFNCDETLNSITFGKDVKSIDGKSIYSCWWVQNVYVDKENPYYCDIDGVVYKYAEGTKDVAEVVHYPNDHDKYLRLKYGYAYLDENGEQHSKLVDDDGNEMEELWGTTEKYDDEYFAEYNEKVRTYVIPSTVTTIGQLAFAYSNITDLYIPEGVTRMESMAVFKNSVLNNIYSYTTDNTITDVSYKAIDTMATTYNSLPEGLEFIGSDCFYYTRGLSYIYIPSSVTEIDHHAFWDAAYKDKNAETGKKELMGITEINVGADEDTFKNKVKTGDEWRPKYDYMLFKKSVSVNYSAQRQ